MTSIRNDLDLLEKVFQIPAKIGRATTKIMLQAPTSLAQFPHSVLEASRYLLTPGSNPYYKPAPQNVWIATGRLLQSLHAQDLLTSSNVYETGAHLLKNLYRNLNPDTEFCRNLSEELSYLPIKNADDQVQFKVESTPIQADFSSLDSLLYGAVFLTSEDGFYSPTNQYCAYRVYDGDGFPLNPLKKINIAPILKPEAQAKLEKWNYNILGAEVSLFPSESFGEGFLHLNNLSVSQNLVIGIGGPLAFLVGNQEGLENYLGTIQKFSDKIQERGGLLAILTQNLAGDIVLKEKPHMFDVPKISPNQAKKILRGFTKDFKTNSSHEDYLKALQDHPLLYDPIPAELSCPTGATRRANYDPFEDKITVTQNFIRVIEGGLMMNPQRNSPDLIKNPQDGAASASNTVIHELGHAEDGRNFSSYDLVVGPGIATYFKNFFSNTSLEAPLIGGTMMAAIDSGYCHFSSSGFSSETPSIVKEFLFSERKKLRGEFPLINSDSQLDALFYFKRMLLETESFPPELFEIAIDGTHYLLELSNPAQNEEEQAIVDLFFEAAEAQLSYIKGHSEISGTECSAWQKLNHIAQTVER